MAYGVTNCSECEKAKKKETNGSFSLQALGVQQSFAKRNLATNAASRTSHENTSCSEKYKIRGAKGIFRLIFWAIGILLDPLVVYLFYLGDDRKCVQVDKNFGTAICVVHFVVDIINIIFYWKLELPADLNESAWIRILLICGNMIIMFPLSLEMLILIHRTKTRTVWNRVALLQYQMVPRIIRLSILTAYGSSSSNLALWAIKLLYSYVYSVVLVRTLEQLSTDVSENIFVLCVIYMAVILFYSLIREMQADVERRRERKNRSSNTS
ncbi:hypothetical protein Patl1_22345 [Pistacia atlantica]|uniref:Uncharacterized protein n=1 Tax=Pistacia atlantica TaxID=434234 RepID=A0ACC0ZYF4_9ROSI|nr:hypothetical protein Patl1_22345 [Pistacia atlantica]